MFVNKGTDDRIIEYLFNSIQNMDIPDDEAESVIEELEKSMNKAGLVQKEVQVTGKNGQVFMRKQWVKAGEEPKATQPPASPTKATKSKRNQLPATPHNLTDKTKHLVPWPSGREYPDHIKNLSRPIPPTWRNIMISPDPDSDLLAIGKDDMDRVQYVYSDSFMELKKSEKFERTKSLSRNSDKVAQYIDALPDKETSDCLKLIFHMGIRPGSTADTKSAVKAYGASTLKGEHVVEEGGNVYLRFVGKKGVSQNHLVSNKDLANMLLKRKKSAGANGDLFDTSSSKLRAALSPLGIKPKDLRTSLATRTAQDALKAIPSTTDIKEFTKIRNRVGDVVCEILGNQRTMALSSYIDPEVFEKWSPQGYRSWKAMEEQKKTK